MDDTLLLLLKHEARTHKICGAYGLGKLFEAAVEHIEALEPILVVNEVLKGRIVELEKRIVQLTRSRKRFEPKEQGE